MKRTLIILWFLILCAAIAWSTPTLTTKERIRVPLQCLDSAGFQVQADSYNVVVLGPGQNLNGYVYVASATTATASAWIDSVAVPTNTGVEYWFADSVANIDGDKGVGYYSGVVNTWKYGKKFLNRFDFYLVDSLYSKSTKQAALDSAVVDGSSLAATAGAISGTTIATGAIGTAQFAAETDIVSNGAITTSSGAVSTVTTVGTATNVGTVTGNVNGSVASVTGAVGSVTGAVGSVTGNVGGSAASVTGAVGSVTGNVGGSVASVTNDVGITQAGADKVWSTTARTLTAGTNITLPASQTFSTTGSVGSVTGAVGSVTGAVGSVTGNVGGSVASVTGAVGSVTGNVGGSVASVTGSVGSVTGNVGGSVASVTGAVGSVTGAAGSVTGNVGGSVASVTGTVGSVTAPVTVGTNSDKGGYTLAPTGSDADTGIVALKATAAEIKAFAEDLMAFFGACDSCYYRLFPEGGSANKDSTILIDPTQAGADTMLGRIIYKHGTVPAVYDSAYFYRKPWW